MGVVNAKAPATLAAPPLSVEFAKVWPNVIEDAVGEVETVGGAFATATFTVNVTVL